MRPELKDLYKQIRAVHQRFVQIDAWLEEEIKCATDKYDMTDVAFASREISELCKEIVKLANQKQRFAERMACLIAIAEANPNAYQTDYVTASPDIKTIVSIPKKSTHPEGFGKLMQYLGVPDELYSGEGDKEVVRPHWPGLVDRIARDLAEGKPMPPGTDPNKTYAEYKLKMRERKGVAE